MPRTIADDLLREVPTLQSSQSVQSAVAEIAAAGIPALPVVAEDGRLCGVFGEREFITALFPGYLGELKYAGFVPHSLDEEIDRRGVCLQEDVGKYATSERIEVEEDYSDAQLVETFLHHRVLIIPVVDSERRVAGVVTRSDFFAGLVARIDAPA